MIFTTLIYTHFNLYCDLEMLHCKTVVFFANVSDAANSAEDIRRGFIREHDAYGASPLPNREEKVTVLQSMEMQTVLTL